eukprot:CAMPEP_0185731278 /NCGR_PEP_ID=MMETSP1171-20130828/12409_1 /TAXON_ID=374046 /ORGANISM="Helicotheca tamensis, Strain CCMP826" /LENGTH=133 /DNA_ID=CAMNT_0028400511 /DNA_START=169 /DNA_END=570 /DNA_ORIENTATION=-
MISPKSFDNRIGHPKTFINIPLSSATPSEDDDDEGKILEAITKPAILMMVRNTQIMNAATNDDTYQPFLAVPPLLLPSSIKESIGLAALAVRSAGKYQPRKYHDDIAIASVTNNNITDVMYPLHNTLLLLSSF